MLDIYLHNSLTKKKEKFKALSPNQVKIYACGITTYDKTHLGHARSALVSDILQRMFKALGFEVLFVKNFTDIDDKIIARANQEEIDWQDLSQEMISQYNQDMTRLNIDEPQVAPLASKHIAEMIAMIEKLLAKGLAYEVDGDIFFKAKSAKNYGILSGKNPAQLIAGWRVEVNEKKINPLDFALWKKAKPTEPFFESPWGKGRPGWHIECSAMSSKYLGPIFDIHLGGADLIFPHHENEIAQSEGCFGHRHVNYWLHHEMVRVERHKMSKSYHNFLTVSELLNTYHPELLRFYLLTTHYRSVIDFKKEAIISTLEGLDRLYQSLGNDFQPTLNLGTAEQEILIDFLRELADDLNTPKAISVLFDWAKQIHKTKLPKNKNLLRQALYQAGFSIGIFNLTPKLWSAAQKIYHKNALSEKEVRAYVQKRDLARQQKNWALADEIRDFLIAKKIKLQDKNGRTSWQRMF